MANQGESTTEPSTWVALFVANMHPYSHFYGRSKSEYVFDIHHLLYQPVHHLIRILWSPQITCRDGLIAAITVRRGWKLIHWAYVYIYI